MSIVFDEFISSLLFAPDYLPNVLRWFRKQPKESGCISQDSFEKILQVISYPCWQRFLQAIDNPCELTQEDLATAEYKLLTETGIARVEAVRIMGEPGRFRNLILTEPAKRLLLSFDIEKFKQDKLRSSVIHLFAVAASNLYGVVEKNIFVDLFNQYMRAPAEEIEGAVRGVMYPVCSEELDVALSPYTELNIDVLLVDGYIVNRVLYNGIPSDLSRFLSGVSPDMKYCYLPMEKFLPYSKIDYFETTSQIDMFFEKLSEKCQGATEGDISMVRLIFSPCYLHEWVEIIDVQLCPMLKSLPIEDQKKMAELFVNAKNSARCWRLKGHSENELPLKEDDVGAFMRVMEGC